MSSQNAHRSLLQLSGIALFTLALAIFTASLTMSYYQLDIQALRSNLGNDYHYSFVEPYLNPMATRQFGSSFTFNDALHDLLKQAQTDIKKDVEENQGLTTNDGEYWNQILQDYKIKDLRFPVTKASSLGYLRGHRWLIFLLSIVLGVLGALLYMIPRLGSLPGIKNNHIYHSALHKRGWLGLAIGIYLIGFYVLLYFFPEHLVNWVILVDPISQALNGHPASQWFLYGFLYTLAIAVMGIRMLIKYRNNRYQTIRTLSVIFFQTAFAFLIPEILVRLNQPSMDLKNIWPLDYDFFFEWNLNALISSGALGIFMLIWGIALIIIAVPVITYFYGKRWYCSWVCGCGGLAETMGDPFRQLSDKSLPAWQIERYLIHGVLVFAIVMTGMVLYTYFTGDGIGFGINRWLILLVVAGVGAGVVAYQRRHYPDIPRQKIIRIAAVIAGIAFVGLVAGYINSGDHNVYLSSYEVRQWYGFYIGAGFSGVIGTGFYPLMGNRVWCRFGCPLAAYLGIVQRFKSRFRISVNGGQCISCGNCSTYCEMGIDVRAYAQRGQDIVRASCVGCGICAAVCPRGVLRLENSAADINARTSQLRTLHISPDKGVRLIN